MRGQTCDFNQEDEWEMHRNEPSNIWVNDDKWVIPDLGKPCALHGGGPLNSRGYCILHSHNSQSYMPTYNL